MNLSEQQSKDRFDRSRVVRLATADAHGSPHLVPATFARQGDVLVIAIDSKPKRHRNLKRLRNILENPNVSLLADQYDDDWTRLWWARADGRAALEEVGAEPGLMNALANRYAQYREDAPGGPLIVITVHKWTGWAFTE
ncbi:TIGR03668 family PPOX class F420-dependent oxidoreductase [Streptomyces scopuliridis]|uniref:TIGR03668 family PPOX class F420-dependent oxidoreductase n=1 Tax=Streptomyces scopuliridis TaxID=452529 RepID=UPI00369B646D